MTAKPPVIVIGAGGHARVCIDALRLAGHTILGACDPALPAGPDGPLGISLLGGDDALANFDPSVVKLVNGVGSVKSLAARHRIYRHFSDLGWGFASVIHPAAIISPFARIEEGAQIMAGSVIQCGASIGANTIVNTRASVDHDCAIGTSVHIAPGCTLSGNVAVGDLTHIGTGAVVIQGVAIGRECLIAAGVRLTRDLADNGRVLAS